ncbi:MAG: 50S ribosomal protein L24 [Thermoplasmatales archaeon]|jgi:large subunit ribosomal protein L24|nr:50S ribosomal protein L24 [Thermoplasmatales archaeon]
MKGISIHLSKELVSKYGIRNFPLRKGDLVRIVRGDAEKDEKLNIVGKEGKVIKIMTDEGKIIIENINIAKADGKMKPRKLDPSALILTKLLLEDKKRKERLTKLASFRNKVVEDEPEPEPPEPEKEKEKEEVPGPEAPEKEKQESEVEEEEKDE